MIDFVEAAEIKYDIFMKPENVLEIIQRASMGICITNAEAKFVAVNDNYCQIYGYEREELIGNGFTIVVPDAFKEQMNLLHEKFLKDKTEIARNWTVVNKSGVEMEISVDTAYSEDIFDKTPHKITFVHKE